VGTAGTDARDVDIEGDAVRINIAKA